MELKALTKSAVMTFIELLLLIFIVISFNNARKIIEVE